MRFQSTSIDDTCDHMYALKSYDMEGLPMPRVSIDDNNRFTMQIPQVEKARLVRAASLENTTLKDFMLRNSLSAADAVIDRAERITLSERDTKLLLDLLDNPRPPNARMVAAIKSRAEDQ